MVWGPPQVLDPPISICPDYFSPESDDFERPAGRLPQDLLESLTARTASRVEFVFSNLRTDRVRGNARAKSESWVQGRVDGDAQICDLVIVGENAHIGGSTILCCDEIVGGESRRPLEAPRPAPSSHGASRFGRQTL